MTKSPRLHNSVSRIPPSRLIKHQVRKQSIWSDLVFGRILGRFGIAQMMTYHKTRKCMPQLTYPYMPKRIPDDAYLYDFHFHSYYSDGRGTFGDILNEIARKRHLNGMVITDHPYHLGKDLNDKIPQDKVIRNSFKFLRYANRFKRKGKISKDFMTFPGSCEMFCKLDEDSDTEVEIIILGVPEDFISRNGGVKRITNYFHAAELIEKVHDDNGLTIIPHPFFFTKAHNLLRRNLTGSARPDAYEGINYTTGFICDKGYHGFLDQLPFSNQTKSIANNFGYFNWMATIVSQENKFGRYFNFPLARKIATVGSSDAHFHSMIGAAATMIKRPLHDIEDLRRVFIRKETQPIYNPLWSINTECFDVYKEIWDAYGPFINEGIEKRPFALWLLAKLIVDFTAFLFD